jgi:hypothetical protein
LIKLKSISIDKWVGFAGLLFVLLVKQPFNWPVVVLMKIKMV